MRLSWFLKARPEPGCESASAGNGERSPRKSEPASRCPWAPVPGPRASRKRSTPARRRERSDQCLFQVVVWAFTALCEQLNIAATAAGAEGHLLSSGTVRVVLALLVLSPPLVLYSVRFAYRLVGPLYRFRKTIQAIAAGEPVALVQLRRGDLLGEFKDNFNAMLKTLEEKGLILLKDPEKAVNAETAEVAS